MLVAVSGGNIQVDIVPDAVEEGTSAEARMEGSDDAPVSSESVEDTEGLDDNLDLSDRIERLNKMMSEFAVDLASLDDLTASVLRDSDITDLVDAELDGDGEGGPFQIGGARLHLAGIISDAFSEARAQVGAAAAEGSRTADPAAIDPFAAATAMADLDKIMSALMGNNH